MVNPLTVETNAIHSTPSRGLGYIAASLRKNGFQVEIWDGGKKGMSQKRLVERLKKYDYDAAGVHIYTCGLKISRELLKMIKSNRPNIMTIAGGPHASGDPEGVFDSLNEADFAFRGEAEEGLPELLKKLSGEEECRFEDIPNLIWKNNGKTACNPFSLYRI